MTDDTGAVHYAVIVRTIRSTRNADLEVDTPHLVAHSRHLAAARRWARSLPAPGTETEADRVVVFQELLCGVLEPFFHAVDRNGVGLHVVAREGLAPYGGLGHFASTIAATSAHYPPPQRRTA